MRKGPGKEYEIITLLNRGDIVQPDMTNGNFQNIQEWFGTWCRVSAAGQIGWVFSSFIGYCIGKEYSNSLFLTKENSYSDGKKTWFGNTAMFYTIDGIANKVSIADYGELIPEFENKPALVFSRSSNTKIETKVDAFKISESGQSIDVSFAEDIIIDDEWLLFIIGDYNLKGSFRIGSMPAVNNSLKEMIIDDVYRLISQNISSDKLLSKDIYRDNFNISGVEYNGLLYFRNSFVYHCKDGVCEVNFFQSGEVKTYLIENFMIIENGKIIDDMVIIDTTDDKKADLKTKVHSVSDLNGDGIIEIWGTNYNYFGPWNTVSIANRSVFLPLLSFSNGAGGQ